MSETPLDVSSVVKDYPRVRALAGVSLKVKRGEVYGLLGPNGAGKTSLISIIVTLEQATEGTVKVFGHDVAREPKQAKVNIGWVGQEVVSSGFFDVEEILYFQAGYYGKKKSKERIDFLLHSLGLYEHRRKKVKQLSGGMKRRMMIAKSLVHSPGLLLLDEPTAGVDVELRTRLWEFVDELRREGISILLTTHYLEEAERLCDRVAIIHKGLIRAEGETHQLIEEWSRKKVVLRLADGQERKLLVQMSKPIGEVLAEQKLPLSDLKDIQVEEGKLEDVFLQLTQEKT